MKIYKLATLSIFLMTNLLIFGYVNPLGNLSLDEIQGDARKRAEMTRIAEIEEEMYLERSPRETQWLTEEEPEDARLIMYLDPAVGYGPRGEYELIEAIEYKYPDGTTRIVSYDGTLLKDK